MLCIIMLWLYSNIQGEKGNRGPPGPPGDVSLLIIFFLQSTSEFFYLVFWFQYFQYRRYNWLQLFHQVVATCPLWFCLQILGHVTEALKGYHGDPGPPGQPGLPGRQGRWTQCCVISRLANSEMKSVSATIEFDQFYHNSKVTIQYCDTVYYNTVTKAIYCFICLCFFCLH